MCGAGGVCGVKANAGHAKPAAGMSGLLALAAGLGRGLAAPNAQLRVLNPRVGEELRGGAARRRGVCAAGRAGIDGVGCGGRAGGRRVVARVQRHDRARAAAVRAGGSGGDGGVTAATASGVMPASWVMPAAVGPGWATVLSVTLYW